MILKKQNQKRKRKNDTGNKDIRNKRKTGKK